MSDERSTLAAIPAGSRAAIGAALAAVFVSSLDLTVIATILVQMIADLGINSADVDRYIWVVNGYLIAYIVAIPIVGRISDLVGRNAAFLGSITVFVAGSIWCANAEGLTDLVIARAIQGAGGGALLPVTMALVGDVLPPNRRTSALGLVGAIDTLGWVLGPIWGALIVGTLTGVDESWRYVFWINVPLGVVAAGLIVFTSRRTTARPFSSGELGVHGATNTHAGSRWRALRQLDVIGSVLLGIALLCVNLALSSGGEVGGAIERGATRALGGSENPLADYLWALLAAAVISAVLFVLWERRAALPVLPLGMFRQRRFSAAIAANFVVGAALIVAMVNTPLAVSLLVDSADASWMSAVMLVPFTAMMAVLSVVGGNLSDRRGERFVAMAGVLLVVLGYGALWVGLQQANELLWMVPGLAASGAGFGLLIAPIGASVLDAVPAVDRGIAAGLTVVFRLLGMTIGISGLTALGVARLQGLTEDIDPVVQEQGETTAGFLIRQQAYIDEYAIPLTIQVLRETFLWAAIIALLGLIPVWFLRRFGTTGERSSDMQPVEPATTGRRKHGTA